MRKFFTAVFAIIVFAGYSQSSTEEIDYYQSIFGMGKKEVVSELLTVEAEKKDAFWSLYDEYESSRKELGKTRIELLSTYAEGYGEMSAEDLKGFMMQSMKLSEQTEKLIKTYYKKLEKDVGAVAAAQFYQVETYLLSEIRVAILGNIPMVEKIKK